MSHQPLDDLELETLEDFLESDSVHEECQNFVMAHGFLTALSICPAAYPPKNWMEIIFEQAPSFSNEKQEKQIITLLERLHLDIQKELESEDEFIIPCELALADSPEELSELQEWASGFMEGVFLTERFWFENDKEDAIAELLLPFMVASDLFEDEEVSQIKSNQKLTQSCIEQIPEVVTDLYLALRTEPEKKVNKPSHNKKTANNKKKAGKSKNKKK
ncbi:YecA family protein [Marinomonas sp. PE14-40]|uniref:YecA/YgfB family protein n=1 Tax=Marinomonas sp. PE14-40 TaxID=3060621 RepID=UPI003F67E5B3